MFQTVAIGNATRFKEVATCSSCLFAWKPKGDRTTEKCPSCGKRRDVRRRAYKPDVAALKAWRSKNPGYATKFSRRYREIALKVIGAGIIKCAGCGCDDIRLIEINHKNGGGGKELKGRSHKFYIDVARLRRPVDDLELLCRVCNAAHALELKYGALPFAVVWGARRVV